MICNEVEKLVASMSLGMKSLVLVFSAGLQAVFTKILTLLECLPRFRLHTEFAGKEQQHG